MEKQRVIRYGWVCIKDLTVTPEIRKAHPDVQYPDQYKVGDTVPSWMYAAFPREIRDKYFEKNNNLKGAVISAERRIAS